MTFSAFVPELTIVDLDRLPDVYWLGPGRWDKMLADIPYIILYRQGNKNIKGTLKCFNCNSAVDNCSNPEMLAVIATLRNTAEIWLCPFLKPQNSRGALAPPAPLLSLPLSNVVHLNFTPFFSFCMGHEL